jgi:hypothetical protein
MLSIAVSFHMFCPKSSIIVGMLFYSRLIARRQPHSVSFGLPSHELLSKTRILVVHCVICWGLWSVYLGRLCQRCISSSFPWMYHLMTVCHLTSANCIACAYQVYVYLRHWCLSGICVSEWPVSHVKASAISSVSEINWVISCPTWYRCSEFR